MQRRTIAARPEAGEVRASEAGEAGVLLEVRVAYLYSRQTLRRACKELSSDVGEKELRLLSRAVLSSTPTRATISLWLNPHLSTSKPPHSVHVSLTYILSAVRSDLRPVTCASLGRARQDEPARVDPAQRTQRDRDLG